jgi:hypothetical protein
VVLEIVAQKLQLQSKLESSQQGRFLVVVLTGTTDCSLRWQLVLIGQREEGFVGEMQMVWGDFPRASQLRD